MRLQPILMKVVGRALFDILEEVNFQAFMTGTDKSLFETWGSRAEHFVVQEGQVTPH